MASDALARFWVSQRPFNDPLLWHRQPAKAEAETQPGVLEQPDLATTTVVPSTWWWKNVVVFTHEWSTCTNQVTTEPLFWQSFYILSSALLLTHLQDDTKPAPDPADAKEALHSLKGGTYTSNGHTTNNCCHIINWFNTNKGWITSSPPHSFPWRHFPAIARQADVAADACDDGDDGLEDREPDGAVEPATKRLKKTRRPLTRRVPSPNHDCIYMHASIYHI